MRSLYTYALVISTSLLASCAVSPGYLRREAPI